MSYHKIDERLFFGYERIARYGSYIVVAHPEKALLDMIYFGRLRKDYRSKLIDTSFTRLQAGTSLANKRARRVLRCAKEHAIGG